MKKTLVAVAFLIVLLAAALAYHTWHFRSRQIAASPVEKLQLNEEELAGRLSSALTFQTVSAGNVDEIPASEFYGFHRYLAESFPAVHRTLARRTIADYSLLYEWKGADPSLSPIVLMAHIDVVPAPAERWQYPPFSGTIADGYVWGRGALDDKSSLMAVLEAMEMLIRKDREPARSILLAFGHDEEVAGIGAETTVKLLKERDIRPYLVLDEGLSITRDLVPGMDAPVAFIGIAEKGYLTIELIARSEGGHSSVPPLHTAIGTLGRAIQQVEDSPFPAELTGVSLETLKYLGPEFPLMERMVMANHWLFRPLIEAAMSGSAQGNAMLRTTTAVTMVQGGIKENVLPSEAKAVVNFRIRPGQTVEDVKAHVARTVDTTRIEIIVPRQGSDPSPVSSTESVQFETLSRTIRQVFPGAVVSPGLLMGATDSRHFSELTPNVYRFAPFIITPEDIGRFHAVNERISIRAYADMIRFYVQFLQNTAF